MSDVFSFHDIIACIRKLKLRGKEPDTLIISPRVYVCIIIRRAPKGTPRRHRKKRLARRRKLWLQRQARLCQDDHLPHSTRISKGCATSQPKP